MTIRPLTEDDVSEVIEVVREAMPVPPEFAGGRHGWLDARTRHLLAHDPDGCWVAEDGGRIAGFGAAVVRDGIWGLSHLAVLPGLHARGIGSRLLEATLRAAEGARGQLIASSDDPRAMRIYARAGFALHPCVSLAGIVDRSAIPAGLASRPSEDFERAAAVSRHVRGGAYGPEDLGLLATVRGAGMLAVGDRGFAVHRDDGSPAVLCATDDEAATDLLWSCFAASPNGGSLHVDLITAGQDWAIRAGLEARLALSLEGPMLTRGELGPLRPWLPSGTFL